MSKAPAPTYYVFHGDDEFSRKAEVEAMKARMGDPAEAELNTTRLDGTQINTADVLSAARAMPFLSDRRLVIVDGFLTWLNRKGAGKEARADLDTLIAALPNLPEWARVIFNEPDALSKAHPAIKLLGTDSHGFQKEFTVPERDAVKIMTSWIARRVVHYSATIEPAAAVELATLVGTDLFAADSEVDKLALYTNGERPINEADVALLASGAPESTLFQLVDLIGARRSREAIKVLHRLFEARQEPLAILGMVNRQFRLLLQAKAHLEGGGDARDLAGLLGFKSSWQTDKLLPQTRNFTLAQLETIYRSLLDIDFRIKTGQMDGGLALDLLIAELLP